ncbi:MAG: hypothetical protein WC586_04880 [Methanoregula sp.]
MQKILQFSNSRAGFRHQIATLAALLVFGCLIILPASANPPSAVILTYNETSSDLSVTITHPVADPQTHYIRKVVITVNGNTVTDASYTSQPSPDTFTRTYPLRVKPGDAVKVTANCSLAGSGSGELTIPAGGSKAPAIPSTQKAAAGLLPLFCAAIIILVKKE